MLNAKSELIAGLVFLVLLLLGLYWTSQIDLAFSSELETLSGPRAYPGLILALMLVLNLALIGQSITRLHAAQKLSITATSATEKRQSDTFTRSLKVITLFIALVLFVMAFEPVGYLLTMFPLLLFASLLNGARQLQQVILVCMLMILTCLVIFRYGLNTVLPEGVLGIDMIL